MFNEEFLLNKTFQCDPGVYRIPLKSHRVWITSPNNPREMIDILENPTLQSKLKTTIEVLDQAALVDDNVTID